MARRVGTAAGLLWAVLALVAPMPLAAFVVLWAAWTLTKPLPDRDRGLRSWWLMGAFVPLAVGGPLVIGLLQGGAGGPGHLAAVGVLALAVGGLGGWIRPLCGDAQTRNRWTGMVLLTLLVLAGEAAASVWAVELVGTTNMASWLALLGLFVHLARLPAADPAIDWPGSALAAAARLGLQLDGDEVIGVVGGQPVRLVPELQAAPGVLRVEAPLRYAGGLQLVPGRGGSTGDPVLDGALVASGQLAAERLEGLHEPLLAVLHGFPRSDVVDGAVRARVPVEPAELGFEAPALIEGVEAAADLARGLDQRAAELGLAEPPRPEAARLAFRSWRLADLEHAWELWGDPEVTRLIGGPWDRDAVRARLVREMLSEREHGVQYWPLFTKRGAFVGACGLTVNAHDEHELGFHLCRRAWGQGFAREAAQATIVHAFGTLGLDRLVAGHHPRNAASERMLQKLEFRFVGELFYPPTGLHHPHYERVRRGAEVHR